MGEIVRQARLHEREALEDLQLQASLMGMEDRAALLANPDAIDLPTDQIADGNVYVCEADGAIVGFGVVLPRADGQAELDGLFVRPDVWGEGYGRVLLEHGAAMARMWGATQLHVVANTQAMGFYRACGFQASGTVQTRFKPATTMVKAL
ncbi:MAG: putative acetyltransferase [Caulobacteraceae bacterium]|nr:putative acetyltransferase [Caulobacteraceae bacterium]